MATVESYHDAILAEVGAAVERSWDDVLDDAARASGSSTIAASGDVQRIDAETGRVIFTAPFAKARERGAYIRPRRGRRGRGNRAPSLRFADGSFRKFARLKKRPYLKPAGDRWGDHLSRRLAEVAR